MILFSVGGVNIRLHASLIVMLAFAALLGELAGVLIGVASVLTHEAGHAVAAKLLGVKISEIEIMPFGAAARIDGMYGLSVMKSAAVALAGPLASVCLCCLAGVFPADTAAAIFSINASIAAFNLLPALPLDGGRVLSRIMGCGLPARRATGICIWSGRVLAALMLIITALGCLADGRINLTYAMAGVYMLASGKRERLAAGGGILLGMLDRKKHMSDSGAMPVRWLAAMEQTRLETLIGGFRPGSMHRIAVYDGNMRLKGVIEEEMILNASMRASPATAGDILA